MIKSLVYYTAFTYLAYNLSLVAYKCYLFSQRYDLDYSEIKRPVSETCDVGLEHVRIIDNVRSFKQADDIIEENPWQPVLFKNFLDDAPTRWNEIYEEHKDTVLTFSKMKTKAFGNLYQSGAVKIMDKVEQKLSDYLDNSFKGNANETLYAAFLELPRSSVRGNSENDIFQNARVDQAFLSNFKEDILGTPLHAAPATQSYTLQYTGKKMWLFVSPKDMDSLDVMNFPSTVPLAGSEKDFFLKKKSILIALQEPGDFLYFPPNWGHAVITQKGPCAMMNLRRQALGLSFWSSPWTTVQFLATKVQEKFISKSLIYAHYKSSKLMSSMFFNEDVVDSPCAPLWRDMML